MCDNITFINLLSHLFCHKLIDLVVVRSNSIIYSPRVRKIINSLSKKYSILALGWNREGVSKEKVENYVSNLWLLNLRAPYGKIRMIAIIPIFWAWIFINLLKANPKVVHSCDFDTIVPCYIYKILFRKKLVFDVCDRYAMAYIPPKFKILYSTINSLEEIFAKHSDALITVSEKLLRTFHRVPEQTAIIMNCLEQDIINPMKRCFNDHKEPTEEYEKGKDNEENRCIFTLLYAGNIVKGRGLENIIPAIENLHDVKLIIAGKTIHEDLLQSLLLLPNVEYRGILEPVEALTLNLYSHAVIILYDPQVPNNNFSMSNKMFEAMMLGLPIITNVSTEVVRDEVNCGIIVDYNNINQITEAIKSLRDDPLLCQKLGCNGQKACLRKYNWEMMEKKLKEIYENLL